MGQKNENWIHLFQILNVAKHKDGFTLYEVTSMVYPRSCPDAITKIVIWKRFNDFKYLYNDLKKRAKSLPITEKLPKLCKASYFKRFSDSVIEDRKNSALELLEFVAKYQELYTSDVFVKFFETSYVPEHQIKGNIDLIRDELHLPPPSDIISINSSSDDEKPTFSDVDSISSTLSTLSISHLLQNIDPLSPESLSSTISQKFDYANIHLENDSNEYKQKKSFSSETNLPSISESDSEMIAEIKSKSQSALVFSTSNFFDDEFDSKPEIQYMIEAAKYISKASEFENNKNYEQAFATYKLGIACLLNGVKNDPDLDRREAVRYKVAKYLLKAEKIYNIHLNLDIEDQHWNDNISKKIADSLNVEKPLAELDNIKVVEILSSVIRVTYTNSSESNIIKVIRKNVTYQSTSGRDIPILPLNIPYMVKLHKYFSSEHSIYVLLQYARGGLLWNYFKNYSNLMQQNTNTNIEKNEKNCTDDCYVQLINEYRLKQRKDKDKNNDTDNKENINNNAEITATHDRTQILANNINMSSDETKNLLKNAQELLESVSELLQGNTNKKISIEFLKDSNADIIEFDKNDQRAIDSIISGGDCWSDECVKQWDRLPENLVIKYASQLVVALEALHRMGVVCYDLQPKNLLLDENGDLLLSYMYHWDNIKITRCPEYPASMYTAPELSTIGPITKAADWWSFGVLIYEMLTGLNFYMCHPGGFTANTILNIPKFISSNAESLLHQLLVYTAEERLGYGINGAENVKKHIFFEKVDWQKIYCRH